MFGIKVVENPKMMQGSYEFHDKDGNCVALGHLKLGILETGDKKTATKIVASTAAYEAIKAATTPLYRDPLEIMYRSIPKPKGETE